MPKLKAALQPPILSEDVISFTDCRNSLAEYFDKTRRCHRPVVVTQNGRVTSAIVNIVDLENLQSNFEKLRETVELIVGIQKGRDEIAKGKCTDQGKVFAESPQHILPRREAAACRALPHCL